MTTPLKRTHLVTGIIITIIILFTILGTMPFWLSELDIQFTSQYFLALNDAQSWRDRWPSSQWGWVQFFYTFGYAFAYSVLFVRLALWLIPKSWQSWLPSSAKRLLNILFLTLMIGNVVVINGLSKPLTDRARPAQTLDFQGSCQYTAPLSIGACDEGKSFPCGHCSIGFSIAAIGIAILAYRPWLGFGIFLGSIFFGGWMSMARIVAGGHYLSDALWSAVVMWISAFIARAIVDRWRWY